MSRTWKGARCLTWPPEMFFPDPGDNVLAETARSICRECPLRNRCLEEALSFDSYGVWGATTRRERWLLKRGRAA